MSLAHSPPGYMPWRWRITQIIWAPAGFAPRPAAWPEPWLAAAGSQHKETALWLRTLALPFHAPALKPVVPMQRPGQHGQGGCKLNQHLIVPMARVYPFPASASRAEPGAWLCVLE